MMLNYLKGKKISLAVVMLLLLSLFIFLFKDSLDEKWCKNKPKAYERLSCLKPHFEKLTLQKSATIALSKAQDLQKEGVIDDCHLAAHFIGEANYKKSDDVGKAFATCSMGCIEGCYHGVMEAHIAQTDDFNKTLSDISATCASVSTDPLLKRQCIHGVGHGILRHDISSLPSALDRCEEFGADADKCHGGVFMENMNNYLLINEESLIKSLPKICEPVENSTNNNFPLFCYDAIGEGLMFYAGHDLKKAQRLCMYVPDKYISTCKKAAANESIIHKKSL